MSHSTTESLHTLTLKPGEADRLVAGHPWLYGNSILRMTGEPADGDLVQVKDHRHRLIGTGFYNSKSKIAVRLLSADRIEPNLEFFTRRIQAAQDLRKRRCPAATSYRLINAESDLLSGLIVDRYEDVLVMQMSSLGMDRRKAVIVRALETVVKPAGIGERNDMAVRKFEGLPESNGILSGNVPDHMTIRLNGLSFEVDLRAGHKTGLYLDQQANYAAVAKFAKGGRVLDCFSFLGGFALHAAKAGAVAVAGLDQSADAVAAATRNAQANGVASTCSFSEANVFDWLKERTHAGPNEKVVPQYDLIILDPPSFTRNRASVPDALRGYKEIHLRALKLLKPGGVLATFCCSHHVDARLFEDVILSAAFDSRRWLRRLESYSQSPDHPILPAVPETEYLKGFAYELLR